jgi:Protein of unknown function (DUF3102)
MVEETPKPGSDEKGLSYVPQINKAYDDLVASHRTSLAHALKLGELLNQAKEAVGHGEWTSWLKTNCPQISHRTADVYMSLAKHKEKFDSKANSQHAANFAAMDDMSIRDAIDAANKADGGGVKTRTPKAGVTKSASPDLKALMQNVGADEIKMALRDANKLAEVAAVVAPSLHDQLKLASPAHIAEVLADALDSDKLQALVKDLTERLAKISKPVNRPVRELAGAS